MESHKRIKNNSSEYKAHPKHQNTCPQIDFFFKINIFRKSDIHSNQRQFYGLENMLLTVSVVPSF